MVVLAVVSQVRLEIWMDNTKCLPCNGTGKVPADRMGNTQCPVCQGTGKADISNLEQDIVQ